MIMCNLFILVGRTPARDLFYALWVPDIFMERVTVTGHCFALMSLQGWQISGWRIWKALQTIWKPGISSFSLALYWKIWMHLCSFCWIFTDSTSTQGNATKVVQARNLWYEILKSQIETGTPYMLFKVIYSEIWLIHPFLVSFSIHNVFLIVLFISPSVF